MGQPASFEPSAAVPVVPGSGEYAVEQVNRPPTVLYTLGIRCVCGLRLCGCEYWFFSDTLHIRGVCMRCGEQDVIFAPPRVNSEVGIQERAEVATHEMLAAVSDLLVMVRESGTKAATHSVVQSFGNTIFQESDSL